MKEQLDTYRRLPFWWIAVSCFLTVVLLLSVLTSGNKKAPPAPVNGDVQAVYRQNLTNQLSGMLEGLVSIERTYFLWDSDLVAPEPDPAAYGTLDSASGIEPVLNRAEKLLSGQKTLFTPETRILEDTAVHYYLDETILAITWKEVLDECTYTFSEVKIAHPSQMRRFLAGGRYNSGILLTTTQMSKSVNAVVASSGDYYSYREIGIVVNEGKAYRDRGHFLDTCYVDENGDLLFTYAGEFTRMEKIQDYVDENNIRFSLSFGPVMIQEGEFRVPERYNSGEINAHYARAALCQLDSLHYLVVTANMREPGAPVPTIAEFARQLQNKGIRTAYALDGGQTASIAMNDQLMNTVSYGHQREISDILYFATALPDAGKD